LWGGLTPDGYFVPTRRFKVLFFKGRQVIRSELIENKHKDHVEIYGPTKAKGIFGEPPTEVPGLVQWGEGGTTYIYLFDREQRAFKVNKFSSGE
jgi:hypothetical protein